MKNQLKTLAIFGALLVVPIGLSIAGSDKNSASRNVEIPEVAKEETKDLNAKKAEEKTKKKTEKKEEPKPESEEVAVATEATPKPKPEEDPKKEEYEGPKKNIGMSSPEIQLDGDQLTLTFRFSKFVSGKCYAKVKDVSNHDNRVEEYVYFSNKNECTVVLDVSAINGAAYGYGYVKNNDHTEYGDVSFNIDL